jgi:GxxExxY protein
MHAEHADIDRLNDLSGRVIGCAFTVLNTLGVGFLEKVYENALAYELRAAGFAVVPRCSVRVYYNDVVVGEYFADRFVDGVLLVEVKTVKALGRCASDAVHQLSQSDRPAALPVA